MRDIYREKSDGLNQRTDEFRQALNDERTQRTWMRESVHILDEFVETMMATKELVEQIMNRVVVSRNGQMHFDFSDPHDDRSKI